VAPHKKGAAKRGAKLAFLDESGFSLKPSVRRTWAPRGQTPILAHRFNWKRLNAIGTLVCDPDGSQPDLLLHLQPKSIKEDAVIAYVEALHEQVPGLLDIVLDHLRAHCGQKFADYQDQNRDWLHVEWFPRYAPELNPIEYFWSACRGKPLANLSPDRLDQLQRAVERAHRKTRADPPLLKGFLVASKLYGPDLLVRPKGEGQ
jgi:transposase